MYKNLSNKKLTLASGVLFAYQVLLTSLAVFGIIRLSIGLFQGECNNVSFGMLD
jgi:hypothetical protein